MKIPNCREEEESLPSSPVFPKPARLASLSEMKQSVITLSSKEPSNVSELKTYLSMEGEPIETKTQLLRKRNSSQGDMGSKKGRSFQSISRIPNAEVSHFENFLEARKYFSII